MAAPRSKPPQGSIKILLLLMCLGLFIFILALRGGKVIEETDNPSYTTLESCSGYCKSECTKALYDQIHTELFTVGNRTTCTCACNSTIHTWFRGR